MTHEASDKIYARYEARYLEQWPDFDAWWRDFSDVYLTLDDATPETILGLDRESYRTYWAERYAPYEAVQEEADYQ